MPNYLAVPFGMLILGLQRLDLWNRGLGLLWHPRLASLRWILLRLAVGLWLAGLLVGLSLVMTALRPPVSNTGGLAAGVVVPADKPVGPLAESGAAAPLLAQGPLPAPALDTSSWWHYQVHVSHYNPGLGGVNCFTFYNGTCMSTMASGDRWQDWMYRAVACVPEWPFGTQLQLPGGELLTCLDRGGAIVVAPDGFAWIDILTDQAPPVPYGNLVDVHVQFPGLPGPGLQ